MNPTTKFLIRLCIYTTLCIPAFVFMNSPFVNWCYQTLGFAFLFYIAGGMVDEWIQ